MKLKKPEKSEKSLKSKKSQDLVNQKNHKSVKTQNIKNQSTKQNINDILIFKLEDEKILSLAQSLQNGTAKRILSLLQDEKERSQKMIVEELELPKASVFYAINILKKGRIIKTARKERSKKGREISYYILNPKPIVICPKPQNFFKEFSTLVPSLLIFLATTLLSYLLFSNQHTFNTTNSVIVGSSAGIISNEVINAKSLATEETVQNMVSLQMYSIETVMISFFIGGIFCILTFLIYRWFKIKRL